MPVKADLSFNKKYSSWTDSTNFNGFPLLSVRTLTLGIQKLQCRTDTILAYSQNKNF